jgi:uncharacterized protein YcaQ
VPVEVEGMRGTRFAVASELGLLEAPPEPASSVAFIAPFNSLVWDTALLASLYVLPIVFGDCFVGRIEPRIDQDRDRVEVLDLWWEDGFTPRRADGFVDALRAYLHFAGADRLEWAPAEKRLFPARS